VIGVVVFEETGRERHVSHVCHRCAQHAETRAIPVPSTIEEVTLVSRFGVCHIPNEYGDETLCYQDATKDGWWHRL